MNYALKAMLMIVGGGKLLQLHAATQLDTLKIPPGNHLEALARDRKGQHSIRINDQWRASFLLTLMWRLAESVRS
jgi:plasmid maintenance system killer protein